MAKTSRTKATRAKTTRAKATRKTAAKRVTKSAAKSRTAAKRVPARKAAARKPAARKAAPPKAAARKAGARKAPARRVARSTAPVSLNGWITHTDIASNNAEATKAWCVKVLGWKFVGSMPTPDGEYHMFAYSDKGGGGVHATRISESPSNTPYVQVRDARMAFEDALAAGAEAVQAPEDMGDLVTTAVVRAPGGVVIGLASPLKGRR